MSDVVIFTIDGQLYACIGADYLGDPEVTVQVNKLVALLREKSPKKKDAFQRLVFPDSTS